MAKAESWIHPVVIFAEKWPSLAFAAQTVACLDITTWFEFKSGKSKVEFTSTRLGSTLTGALLDVLAKQYTNQQRVTVLIQGCVSFINQFCKWSEDVLNQVRSLELTPTGEIDDWDETF